jgi:hypothetical protein
VAALVAFVRAGRPPVAGAGAAAIVRVTGGGMFVRIFDFRFLICDSADCRPERFKSKI